MAAAEHRQEGRERSGVESAANDLFAALEKDYLGARKTGVNGSEAFIEICNRYDNNSSLLRAALRRMIRTAKADYFQHVARAWRGARINDIEAQAETMLKKDLGPAFKKLKELDGAARALVRTNDQRQELAKKTGGVSDPMLHPTPSKPRRDGNPAERDPIYISTTAGVGMFAAAMVGLIVIAQEVVKEVQWRKERAAIMLAMNAPLPGTRPTVETATVRTVDDIRPIVSQEAHTRVIEISTAAHELAISRIDDARSVYTAVIAPQVDAAMRTIREGGEGIVTIPEEASQVTATAPHSVTVENGRGAIWGVNEIAKLLIAENDPGRYPDGSQAYQLLEAHALGRLNGAVTTIGNGFGNSVGRGSEFILAADGNILFQAGNA